MDGYPSFPMPGPVHYMSTTKLMACPPFRRNCFFVSCAIATGWSPQLNLMDLYWSTSAVTTSDMTPHESKIKASGHGPFQLLVLIMSFVVFSKILTRFSKDFMGNLFYDFPVRWLQRLQPPFPFWTHQVGELSIPQSRVKFAVGQFWF